MNFVAVAIVSATVFGHPFNKSHLLIGLNCILYYLNNISQITKQALISLPYSSFVMTSSKIYVLTKFPHDVQNFISIVLGKFYVNMSIADEATADQIFGNFRMLICASHV